MTTREEDDPYEGPGGGIWPDSEAEEDDAAASPAGPRLIVVDVEAVVEGSQPLRELWRSDRSEAAGRLINLLTWAVGGEGIEFVLVLDREVTRVRPARHAHGALRLYHPAPSQSVSEAMMLLLDQISFEGRGATVVSSDLEVIHHAAEHHIQAVLGDLFALSLLGGQSAAEEDAFPEPPGLSPQERAEWQAFVDRWQRERGR